jgi:predicted SnoaL-like aldol condensation-catalyzing enzyme
MDAKNYPNTRGEIKRVFADGDYVLLHCHYTGFFGENGDAIIDIFRAEDGKVSAPLATARQPALNLRVIPSLRASEYESRTDL